MERLNTREKKRAIIIFSLTFAIIASGVLLFGYDVWREAVSAFTIEVDNNGGKTDKNVTVFIETSQEWVNTDEQANVTIGAQYDGIVINDMKEDIRDWKLSIALPAEGKIDSSWNGSYTEKNGEIIVEPLEYNAVIPSGGSQTFGFVLYSDTILELNKFTITGYRNMEYIDYGMFWCLIAAAAVWVICLIGYLTVVVRIRNLNKKRENDKKIISQALNTFARLIDAKDKYTKGHSIRVAAYTREIAKRMHMSSEQVDYMGYIALMHDCGKMGIPDKVLNKPGALTPEERKIIESHTLLGGEALESFTAIEGIRDGALYHHERYDGEGYPKGLRGEDIPLCARIICIADSYDAMSSNRCYRRRLSDETILSELAENAGKQFDPDIVRHMIDMIHDGFVKKIHGEEQVE